MFDHLNQRDEKQMVGTPEGVPTPALLAELASGSSESSPPHSQREREGLADRAECEGIASAEPFSEPVGPPRLRPIRKGQRLVKKPARPKLQISPEQRLLVLDTWRRSGLPATDFSTIVGIPKHTLYTWKKRFEQEGPAGLMDRPRGGRKGSRLPELTKRTILMLKESNPDWGCQRISDMLVRGPALPASPTAVARVLKEAGYELEEVPTHRHPDQVRRFERARSNQLWQTDLFTFVLKRQNRRVYLVAFMDDHSRFVTGFGLHASQSTALVLEVLRTAISSYGVPEEVLTDRACPRSRSTSPARWAGSRSAFTRRENA
jgi:transposase